MGRVPLFLLDTDVDENNPADRQLTARLYCSDLEVRISQEILLGIGGVRALRAAGLQARRLAHERRSLRLPDPGARRVNTWPKATPLTQAAEQMRKTNVFTTHTPVPAGNDEFPLWLIDKYLCQLLGRAWAEPRTIHRPGPQRAGLGRNLQHAGAGAASFQRRQQRRLRTARSGLAQDVELPVARTKRGRCADLAHHQRRAHRHLDGAPPAHALRPLPGRRLAATTSTTPRCGSRSTTSPTRNCGRCAGISRRKLVNFAIERARRQWVAGGFHPVQVVAGGVLLDPYSLTIGFARRFATYKRAQPDPARCRPPAADLINNPDMPVQIIFAGKAHPADEPGKLIIQEVYRAVKDAEAGGRLVFLEDYDMNLARYLVQGVDVWMNTPRRPKEASGTVGYEGRHERRA